MRIGLTLPRRHGPAAAALVAVVLAASPVTAIAPAAPATGHWVGIGDPSLPGFLADGSVVASAEVGPDGRLYANGIFFDAGGDPTADALAVYEPTSGAWVGLGSNGTGDGAIYGVVMDIAWYQGRLIVAGMFTDAGGVVGANNIAAWDGSHWSTVGAAGAITGTVGAIAVQGSTLWAGGSFTNAGDVNGDRVARFDGTSWSGLPGADGAITGSVHTILPLADGTVFAGGGFTNSAGGKADHVARWDPATAAWGPMGGAGAADDVINGYVNAMTIYGGRLVIGGDFTAAGGDPLATRVAAWNGTTWVGLGGSGSTPALPDGGVMDFSVYGSNLIVDGGFTAADGVPGTYSLAAWNGRKWLSLGGTTGPAGTGSYATSIAGRVLYAAGSFEGITEGLTSVPNTALVAAYGLPAAPSAPRTPVATAGLKRVSLAWAAPATANGATIRDYIVQYRKKGTTTWRTFADGVRTTRAAVVTGLVTGVTYEFRVRAVNDWGSGAFSPVVAAKAR